MGADYSFYVKTIETHARTFFKVIIFSIGSVHGCYLIMNTPNHHPEINKTPLRKRGGQRLFVVWTVDFVTLKYLGAIALGESPNETPAASQCCIQWLYIAPLFITLRIKTLVVAYFFNFFQLFQQQKNFFL